jgi:hypothetical protein
MATTGRVQLAVVNADHGDCELACCENTAQQKQYSSTYVA